MVEGPATPEKRVVALPESAAARAAMDIIARLRAAGYSAYLVGGCVRDLVLGDAPKDYDVATAATPAQVRDVFGPVIEVGVAFGVVRVARRVDGERVEIEVATFRAEAGYADGRRPDSVRFTDAREDVLRRDFTINGLLAHVLDGQRAEVIDWVGGLTDLGDGVLRAIGQADARFAEDHLRILRAVRFATRFGLTIEPATWAAAAACVQQLERISHERVRDELLKMLGQANAVRAIELLGRLGVHRTLWPALAADTDLTAARLRIERALALVQRPPAVIPDGLPVLTSFTSDLAIALFFGPASARVIGADLRLSSREISALAALWIGMDALANLPADPAALVDLPAWIRTVRRDNGDALLVLAGAVELYPLSVAARLRAARAAADVRSWRPEPFVTGATLKQLGFAAGPDFRPALTAALDAQLAGRDAGQALDAARRVLETHGPTAK